MAGATIERVASVSGVAKTTIYRHWSDRGALVFAALESLIEVSPIAVSLSLRDDLLGALGALLDGLNDSVWASVLPSLIEAAERNDHLRRLEMEFTARRRAGLEARLQLAVERSEIAADTSVDLLASQLVGPLFYRRFMSRQPTSHDLLAEHVYRLLMSVGAVPVQRE